MAAEGRYTQLNRLGRAEDATFEQASKAIGTAVLTASLVQRTLHQDIKSCLVGRGCQAFDTLVVLSARRWTFTDDLKIKVISRRAVALNESVPLPWGESAAGLWDEQTSWPAGGNL